MIGNRPSVAIWGGATAQNLQKDKDLISVFSVGQLLVSVKRAMSSDPWCIVHLWSNEADQTSDSKHC